MAFSKVIFNGTTLMDVTTTTATPANVTYPLLFTQANGVQASGTNNQTISILFEQDANGFIVLSDNPYVPTATGVSF